MEHRVVVVGLIKNGNKVLLGQKPPGKGPYPDTWHIPGGGIVLGEESADEAIRREIEEETGLNVKNLKKVEWDTDVEPNKHGEETYYIFLQYTCYYYKGDVRPGGDMNNFQWVDVSRLSEFNLNKPTEILFEKLGYL